MPFMVNLSWPLKNISPVSCSLARYAITILNVETGVYSLETAFETTINSEQDGPTVAVLAEYDALPQIGHACGHNIIATTALGATLALNAVAQSLPGRVKLLGTCRGAGWW